LSLELLEYGLCLCGEEWKYTGWAVIPLIDSQIRRAMENFGHKSNLIRKLKYFMI
jgi:hypothetical protein